MNYQETLAFMFAQLPMYQRVGQAAYKANLDNTIALLAAVSNPERAFKSIHIAGTNGKGSTSHMLASVFQEAGYKTGLYTSPHLLDFRERIKINGQLISEKDVVDFIASLKEVIEEIKPSFFELTVAMAFVHFQKEKVDIAIIETGLGGRLDSTNVIVPELAVITNIGMDHMQFLGNDLLSIAKEKAGIIKAGIPVIIGEADAELKTLFSKIASEKNAPIHFAEKEETPLLESDLKGSYQRHNLKTAFCSIKEMQRQGWSISHENIVSGLKKVRSNTGLAGRWDVIQEKPKVICDTAHNREGITEVFKQLLNEKYEKLHIVWGMVNDKSITETLQLLPSDGHYYFCQASVPRSLAVADLYEAAMREKLKGISFSSVLEAYEAALSQASENDLLFVGGSTFVVADLLQHLNSDQ